MFDRSLDELFNTGLWALPGALGSITLWMCGTGLMQAYGRMSRTLSRARVAMVPVEVRRAL